MSWIVIGEEKGKIKLVSKSGASGLLPNGSYLTIEDGGNKFILRVEESRQSEPYSPSPMIVDMDLSPLKQDRKCQNIIYARRIKDITNRDDGFISFIPAQSIARRSNQEEIQQSVGDISDGAIVFLSTAHSSQNQILIDDNHQPITVKLPNDIFYHQILICGKTGSGKTVASKYLAQYFVEELEGAVLAINVKDVDFLKMDLQSTATNPNVTKEWNLLNQEPHGIENFIAYFPANTDFTSSPGVTTEICRKITMDVKEIEPESLNGLLQGISDVGAQNLPHIFRYWQEVQKDKSENFTFNEFVEYFIKGEADGRMFRAMDSRRMEMPRITLHSSTYQNIQRNLISAIEFFDNKEALTLNWKHILRRGKMSVINVAGNKGIEFGSIMLRHLLHQIVQAKSQKASDVPILIIIDEVHQFYNTGSSKEALGVLDTICRTGRSKEIGVIFSSQNPSDIPRGLSTVINTKIFFKTDIASVKAHGINATNEEIENLKKGFAAVNIHDLSQVKYVKFPMALSGVFEKEV